ncbi:MAG: hypothetical protein LBJ13_03735 [Puniceicoccales bacterium]|jgi:protein-S-isoprenylcysteine O-methyltransferase Ste14|nr:hypothetical protein [Puniceicoccales bacterium]
MILEWIKTITILPINVLLTVPMFVIYSTDCTSQPNYFFFMILGGILLAAGLLLATWTMWLFAHRGEGMAAPWNSSRKFTIEGPYAHVRNPMIASVLMMQIAEALLFNSWIIFGLFGLFLLGNMIYFPLFEEKSLERRFGDDYRIYKHNVPRWIPRLTPWRRRYKR